MSDDQFRILLSYHYFQRKDMHVELRRFFGDELPEVFADSGAYSAMSQGAEVDVDSFGKWLVQHRDLFTVYANLDVIGADHDSAEGTWANQQHLEQTYGLTPLPVFHAGEPWSALDRYLDHGYSYIALGGLVGRPVRSIMPWLIQCFRRAEGRAVFHGFGLTSWEPIKALPWFSIDSSSWGSGYRWGFMRLFDPRIGSEVRVQMFDHDDVYRNAPLIRLLGGDPAKLAQRDQYHRSDACRVAGAAWREAEKYLRTRHGRIVIPGDPDRIPEGLRWYYADTDLSNLASAAEGLRLYLADGSMDNLADGATGLRLYLADTNLNDLADGAGVTREPT